LRSRYSDWLRAGRSGVRIPVEARFPAPVQSGSEAHPSSCTMGTGFFPGVKSGPGVTLTPHPLLVPCSRKGRAILYSPYGQYVLYRVSVPVQRCISPFFYLRARRSRDRISVEARFSVSSTPVLGPTRSPVQRARVFRGVKRSGCGVDHPPHLALRLKKESSYTSTSPSVPLR
jgi:hypothetical protein